MARIMVKVKHTMKQLSQAKLHTTNATDALSLEKEALYSPEIEQLHNEGEPFYVG